MSNFEEQIQANLPNGIRFFSVLEQEPYGKRYFLSLEIACRKTFWENELTHIQDIDNFIALNAKEIATSVKVRAVEILNEAKGL